jgi:hypothetical protein
VESLDDALSTLRRMQAVGAFSVKSYNQPRRDQRQQIIEAARRLRMMVVPEGGSLFQHNMTMIADGHTTIEHSLPVAEIYDDVRQFLVRLAHRLHAPPWSWPMAGASARNYWYQHTDVWKEPILSPLRAAAHPRRALAPPDHDPGGREHHIDIAQIANQLHDLGVSVQIGATASARASPPTGSCG